MFGYMISFGKGIYDFCVPNSGESVHTKCYVTHIHTALIDPREKCHFDNVFIKFIPMIDIKVFLKKMKCVPKFY